MMTRYSLRAQSPRQKTRAGGAGFSLLELLVSVAVFTIVSGAAFALFNLQQSSSLQQKDRVGLNLSLRNAISQLQMDVANGGNGYLQGTNIPNWPVGVTMQNNVVPAGSTCYDATTLTYGANCFDQLNVILAANPTTYPPVNATDATGGTSPTLNCSETNTTTVYAQAAVVNGVAWTLAKTASAFYQGDQVLFLSVTGSTLTTAILTANASSNGNAVVLPIQATNADGSNSLANDPLDITACDGNTPCLQSGTIHLATQFCANAWIIKLAPVSYQVNSSNPSDPQLTRTQGGQTSTLMDQVIGFKVGASIFNSSTDADSTYNYDACSYAINTSGPGACPSGALLGDQAYNFTLVRAVRVSLIGRTASNPSSPFRNSFDQGPYQVQGTAIIINPRNMSMND